MSDFYVSPSHLQVSVAGFQPRLAVALAPPTPGRGPAAAAVDSTEPGGGRGGEGVAVVGGGGLPRPGREHHAAHVPGLLPEPAVGAGVGEAGGPRARHPVHRRCKHQW